jgi:biopolymer transport protein ExbD
MASLARRTAQSVTVDLSLTSMIDVTFLLLVCFLVTTRFRPHEGMLEALLPKGRGTDATPTTGRVETRVKLLWYDTFAAAENPYE